MVNPAEIGDDHRDWQGDDQDATQGADGAKDLPGDGLGHHVPISEREKRAQGEGPCGKLVRHPPCQSFTRSFIRQSFRAPTVCQVP